MLKHVCGACTKTFKSEAEYLKHNCSVTHHSPRELEHTSFQTQTIPVTMAKNETILFQSEMISAIRETRQAKRKNAKI